MFIPILAGIGGTLLMTLFAKLAFFLLRRPYDVVRILANMLRFKTSTPTQALPSTTVYAAATALHYGIGVAFAFVYQLALNGGLLLLHLGHAVLYGTLLGAVAMLGWALFFAMHPGPPAVKLKIYLPVIGLAHIVLAVGMFYMYQRSYPPAAQDTITLCAAWPLAR